MLRKPTWKRWRLMEREARERCKAPLAVDDDYTGTGDVERFSIKKKVMKSRFGKSLSRLGERRSSDESGKKRTLEQETHSAVDFSSTADTE